MKILLIIIGVIFMGAILEWIKNIFDCVKNYKTLSEEHKEIKGILEDEIIKEYLKEDGRIRKEHKDIMNVLENDIINILEKDILGEESKIREPLNYLYNQKKIEEENKKTVEEIKPYLNETIKNINTFHKDYVEKEVAFQILEKENYELNKKIDKQNRHITTLEKEIENLKEDIKLKDDYIKNRNFSIEEDYEKEQKKERTSLEDKIKRAEKRIENRKSRDNKSLNNTDRESLKYPKR